MKRTPSIVWRFFDRIEHDNRVVAIVCKLCDNQYKYFGNTTNLRAHLLNKHPIQWELGQNGTLDEGFRIVPDEESNQSRATPRSRKKRYGKSHKNDNVRYSISVNNNPGNEGADGGMPLIKVDVLDADTDAEQHDDNTQATINLVKQMHRGSDEEWLNEDVFETVETYQQPQKKRRMSYRTIKREVATPPRISSYRPETPKKQVIIDARKDENHVFGEYVGNKLRKFKNNQTRSNIQQLITTILWQAEYGVYDSMETIKRVLLHSVQEMSSNEQVIVQEININGEEGTEAMEGTSRPSQ